MNLHCAREELLKAAKQVAKSLPSQTPLPILHHLLLRAEGSQLTLTATDLVTRTTVGVRTDGGEGGEMLVPAKTFIEIVTGFPKEADLCFSTGTADRLRISSASAEYTLNVRPVSQFPELVGANSAGTHRFQVMEKMLHGMLHQVLPGVSPDDTRPALTGVCLQVDGRNEEPVAALTCDLRRMLRRRVPAFLPGEEEGQAMPTGLIPQDCRITAVLPQVGAVRLLALLDAKQSAFLDVRCDGRNLQVTTPDRLFVTRLLEVPYPGFDRIYPTPVQTRWSVPLADLKAAVKRLNAIGRDDAHRVRVRVDPEPERGDRLLLEAVSATGCGTERVPLDLWGYPAFELVLNLEFLQDALGEMKGDDVHFCIQEPDRPIVLAALDDPLYEVILMPRQILSPAAAAA